MRWVPGRVRSCIPTSIAWRAVVLVLLVAVSIGLPALAAHHLLMEALRARYEASCEALLAAVAQSYLADAPATGPELDGWLERLTERAGRLSWAGVFDQTGAGVEFRRRTSLRREDVVAQIPFGEAGPTLRPCVLGGQPACDRLVLTIPQPGPGVRLAALVELDAVTTTMPRLALAGLAAVAAVGLAGAWAWYRWAIRGPIRRLGGWVAAAREGLAEAALAHALPEELQALACGLEQTQRELLRWRAEAGELRYSLDARVEARTKHMSRALRVAASEADTDTLTKLYNRRVLLRELPELFDRQRAAGRELVALLIDVDHFKQLNDALGHPAGDKVLAFLGELIRATVRKRGDLPIRHGGDEFLLLLPDTTALEATSLARRLRDLFGQHCQTLAGVQPRPSLSAGVAALQQHRAHSWQELLELADAAMYFARQRGLAVATPNDVAEATGRSAGARTG